MRTLIAITLLAAAVGGCGSSSNEKPAPPAPAKSTPVPVATADLSGYSKGVKTFYAGIPAEPPEDPELATEAEYHQPPRPAEARMGDAITATGSNDGGRLGGTGTGGKRPGPPTAGDLPARDNGD